MKILLRSTLFKRLTLCIMISGSVVAALLSVHTPSRCAVELWACVCRLLGMLSCFAFTRKGTFLTKTATQAGGHTCLEDLGSCQHQSVAPVMLDVIACMGTPHFLTSMNTRGLLAA